MSKGNPIVLGDAVDRLQPVIELLGGTGLVHIAGSIRRSKEQVRDGDLVVTRPVDVEALRDAGFGIVQAGAEKVRILVDGFQVDIVATDEAHLGGCLLYLTGPHELNTQMRAKAKAMGLLLNQRGLFDRESGELVAGDTERAIFEALGYRFQFASSRGKKPLKPLRSEWTEKVASASGNDPYDVSVDGNGDLHCTCKSFSWRRECRHLQIALDQRASREEAA